MIRYDGIRRSRHHSNHPFIDLFAWAEARDRIARLPLAVRWLRQRHPLSPERAALIVEQVGLGERDR